MALEIVEAFVEGAGAVRARGDLRGGLVGALGRRRSRRRMARAEGEVLGVDLVPASEDRRAAMKASSVDGKCLA